MKIFKGDLYIDREGKHECIKDFVFKIKPLKKVYIFETHEKNPKIKGEYDFYEFEPNLEWNEKTNEWEETGYYEFRHLVENYWREV